MVAGYFIVFFLAAAAAAQPLVCNTRNFVLSDNCGHQRRPVFFNNGVVGGFGTGLVSGGASSGSGVLTRNIVVKGKYPVALCNCGPTPDRQVPVTTSHVKTPVQVKPTVRLPCTVPAPKCVSHTCKCYKTVLRPHVHDHIVTVPSVQSYVETFHKPVVENLHYEAVPTNCNDNCNKDFVLTRVGGNCGVQNVQNVQTVQTCQVPQVQTCQVPQVQTVQTCQVPQVQTVQACQVPQYQTVQTCQVPQIQTVQTCQVPKFGNVQTVQVPLVENVQTVQVPQFSSFSVPTCSKC